MQLPGPDCIRSLELHGSICIDRAMLERVKQKLDSYVGDNCTGCQLTLIVNEHDNLALVCGAHGPGADENCCLDITYVEGRGHRAACARRDDG